MSASVRSRRLFAFVALFTALWTAAASADAHEDLYFDVGVRGTGSATIHADVYNNPANRGAVTIMAVHGFTEVGSMFGPLASAIYADSTLGQVVKRIVSIDLIGHGLSSLPTLPSPTTFGDLLIEDNVSVVIQSIDKLRILNKGPQIVMAHSMGGLALQAAQETLLAQNSSLAKHGVFGAILIASVPNRGVSWTQLLSPDPSPFVVVSPTLGAYIDVPPAIARLGGGYTLRSGLGTTPPPIAPNTPSEAVFIANDWSGLEPLTTALELVGTSAPLWRPLVRQNAFALSKGTVLTVLGFSQDVLAPIEDQDDLYTYLTGNSSTGLFSLFRPIVASDAVHAMFVSNPTGLLAALKNGVIHP
jgi:pimeloyl-ACP methyl ester carboxylesterase